MQIPRHRYPWLLAAGIGLAYALATRLLVDSGDFYQLFNNGLLSWAFLVVMPVGLGAITAHFTSAENKWQRLVWGPLLTVLVFLATALLFHLEGLICVAIMSPLFLLMAGLGALCYSLIADNRSRPRDKTLVVAVFALLPLVAGPLESRFANPDSFRRVENVIDIAAPAPVVWQHIIRVAPIQAADLSPSLLDGIGFPRPVAATLTREGVGGVRHATFERGVEFIETVDDWQPLRRLSFSIEPNTATIPPSTFDEHVTVGGRFFDVLRGTYELRPLGPGRTRLVLYSQQRVSTHLNWYAGLWTSYVMGEIQQRILGVLKQRCEASPTPNASPAGRGA